VIGIVRSTQREGQRRSEVFLKTPLFPLWAHLPAGARGPDARLDASFQGTDGRGVVTVRAAIARKLGLTRVQVTQLLDLLLVASDMQAQVLELKAIDGAEPISERALRAVAYAGSWAEQRAVRWAG
jgi:hypothetical protein